MKNPSYQELLHARNFLESRLEDFPDEKCSITTKFLKEVFGLEEIAGRHSDSCDAHAWNYGLMKGSKEKGYIDLTMDQIGGKYRKVETLSTNTNLLIPCLETTIRQKLKEPKKMKIEGKGFKNLKELAEIYQIKLQKHLNL